MSKAIKTLFILFAVLLCSNLYSADRKEIKHFTFRNYTWKTTLSEVLKSKGVQEVTNSTVKESDPWSKTQASEKDEIAGMECSISYLFDKNDKLKLIAIGFLKRVEKDVSVLKSIYVKKYGEPHKTEDKDEKEGIRTLYWEFADVNIKMTVYSKKSGIIRTGIYISIDYSRKKTEAEIKAEEEKAEKDADKI